MQKLLHAQRQLLANESTIEHSLVECIGSSMEVPGFFPRTLHTSITYLPNNNLLGYYSRDGKAEAAVWQDVYHVPTTAGDVYLKLMVLDDVLIVSFKELGK